MPIINTRLSKLLAKAAGTEPGHLPSFFETLLELSRIEDLEIELRDLLAEERVVAELWEIADVRVERPDLDDDQAWAVLQQVERLRTSEPAIDIPLIRRAAEELYPLLVTAGIPAKLPDYVVQIGVDGPDQRFDVICRETGDVVAFVPFWDERRQAGHLASSLAAALNDFVHCGGMIVRPETPNTAASELNAVQGDR